MKRMPMALAGFAACLALGAGASDATNAAASAPVADHPPEGRISEWSVPTNLAPRDPAVDARGVVFFAVSRGDRIARFDPRTERFTEWKLPEGTRPHGVVVASDGKVFFGGYGNGTIGELDPATGAMRFHKSSDPASGVYALAADRAGNIWCTERDIGRIGRLERATGTMTSHRMPGEPYAIVEDRQGRLWVSRIAADRLGILDPRTGETAEIFTGAGSRPRRLALGPDGMLWVTYYGTGKVAMVDPARRLIAREFDLPGGANVGPYAVAVDSAGRVWVGLFQTDSVTVLEPKTGKFTTFRVPGKMSGIRHAVLDQDGHYWYISTSLGKLGRIQ